jgi:hypothetical protein
MNELISIKRTQCGGGLKFVAKYFNPYKIKRVLRNNRYIVKKIGQAKGTHMICIVVNYMKSWSNILEDNPTEDI